MCWIKGSLLGTVYMLDCQQHRLYVHSQLPNHVSFQSVSLTELRVTFVAVIVVYQMVSYHLQLCGMKGVYSVARGRILGVDYLADTGHFS